MLRHLFLHIHKTGGTSVVENLWKPAVPLAERHVEEDLIHGGELYGEYYSYLHMHVVSWHHGLAYRDVFAAFWNAGKVPTDCRLYSGHFGYGVHEVIGGPCRYSTVLRNPIDRTLSHYHLVRSLGAFDGDFRAYLDGNGPEVSNYQVKCLTRHGFEHGRRMTECDLDDALHNLDRRFDYCVTEHIHEFVDGMIARHGFRETNSRVVHNRTAEATRVKGSPHAAHQQFPVDPALLPRLAELNELDMRLYEHAKRVSAERWLTPAEAEPATIGQPRLAVWRGREPA